MKRRKFIAATGLSIAGIGKVFGQMAESPTILKKKRSQVINTSVLVVGGGPAGIGAAIGSAKAGAKTLLIENYWCFCGFAAWGLGMCMNQMRPDGKPRGYVQELLLKKLQNYGAQAVRLSSHQYWVNVEYLKVAVLDALDEVGCSYLVHAKAVDATVKGNRITGVIFSSKSGLVEINADVVVDCTGDADVAYFAGAETLIETGALSPQTLLFNVANVGSYSRKDMAGVLEKARAKYPLISESWGTWDLERVSNNRHFYINHSGTRDLGNFDVTDPLQFSKAECISRRQVIQMTEAMREYAGGELKNVEIVGSSTQIGVRESRRLKGQYILTEEDALNGSRFDDVVAWRSGWLDVGFVKVSQMKIHQVPYRSLVPEKTEGLLAAGRCISATHLAASAGKSMGNCFATGHAAGVAAAISARNKVTPAETDIKVIQEAIRKDEVDLNKGGEEQPKDMPM